MKKSHYLQCTILLESASRVHPIEVLTHTGAPLERVRRVRPHPLKFGNGCAAPVLKKTKAEVKGFLLLFVFEN